jgi:Fe-S oxidoreductase
MCPSYRATGEERYSTRGRARLLWEMLQGEVIKDGWQSEEVKEALDWCLACKGCRSDCPTHTDMAAYKAEFLSHYYKGCDPWPPTPWARSTGGPDLAPRRASPISTPRRRGSGRGEAAGRIAPQRQLPAFAEQIQAAVLRAHTPPPGQAKGDAVAGYFQQPLRARDALAAVTC